MSPLQRRLRRRRDEPPRAAVRGGPRRSPHTHAGPGEHPLPEVRRSHHRGDPRPHNRCVLPYAPEPPLRQVRGRQHNEEATGHRDAGATQGRGRQSVLDGETDIFFGPSQKLPHHLQGQHMPELFFVQEGGVRIRRVRQDTQLPAHLRNDRRQGHRQQQGEDRRPHRPRLRVRGGSQFHQPCYKASPRRPYEPRVQHRDRRRGHTGGSGPSDQQLQPRVHIRSVQPCGVLSGGDPRADARALSEGDPRGQGHVPAGSGP